MVVLVRRRGSVDPIIDLLADKVDAEGNEGDAEARSGMAELIRQHRVLPPLVPPPEELSCGSQWLLCHFLSLCLSLSLSSLEFQHCLFNCEWGSDNINTSKHLVLLFWAVFS